jgi:hypothetical protein
MEKLEHIKIVGFKGLWHVIDTAQYPEGKAYLLEHEFWGDETAFLVVNKDLKVLCDEAWNGFDDYNYIRQNNITWTKAK